MADPELPIFFRYVPELELAPAYVDETSMELVQIITTVPERP